MITKTTTITIVAVTPFKVAIKMNIMQIVIIILLKFYAKNATSPISSVMITAQIKMKSVITMTVKIHKIIKNPTVFDQKKLFTKNE